MTKFHITARFKDQVVYSSVVEAQYKKEAELGLLKAIRNGELTHCGIRKNVSVKNLKLTIRPIENKEQTLAPPNDDEHYVYVQDKHGQWMAFPRFALN